MGAGVLAATRMGFCVGWQLAGFASSSCTWRMQRGSPVALLLLLVSPMRIAAAAAAPAGVAVLDRPYVLLQPSL